MECKYLNDAVSVFDQRLESIDSLFSSYRDLHEMYAEILKSANVNPNALTAFERAKDSATRMQGSISNRLYSQGFVLLTGMAEALLKDIFEDLLVQNFEAVKGARGLNFSAIELQKVITNPIGSKDSVNDISSALGQLMIDKIFKTKNPAEKVNFQNVKTMRSVFLQYFEIEVPDSETLSRVHRDRHRVAKARHLEARDCLPDAG